MKKTSLFKQYLLAEEILMIPVAHDPLCATIIQRAGFKVVGCGGYANSAALLGAPDMQWICRCLPTATMATEIPQTSRGPSSSLKKRGLLR
jgi:2-methylisocitrate lyase-like PEP mutase family enzyme